MRAALRTIGCIGDVHCEDELLAAAIAELRAREVDAILCTGDLVDGTGDIDRVCALLQAHGVLAVRGNHERWFLGGTMRGLAGATRQVADATRAYLASLPPTLHLPTVAGGLMLCHGVGVDDMLRLRPDTDGYGLDVMMDELRGDPAVALMVGGHTHMAMSRRLPGLWVVNPGTLHRGYLQGIAVVDAAAGEATYLTRIDDAWIDRGWP